MRALCNIHISSSGRKKFVWFVPCEISIREEVISCSALKEKKKVLTDLFPNFIEVQLT